MMRGCSRPLVAACVLLLGACGGGGSGEEPIRGPEGGILEFDGAMLDPPPDGGVVDSGWVRRDAGKRDAGTVVCDAGRKDAGDTDGGAHCTGIAPSCSSLSIYDCTGVDGCSLGGECEGLASSCYYLNSYECRDQDGCYWSTYSEDCSGSARSCRYYSSSLGCIDQRGCYWNDQCEGTVTACVLLETWECESQPGCRLEWY